VVFALAIVLGLEPLRRRLQGPVDRFFYGELPRLQRAMVELGEALSADRDPGALVHELVEGCRASSACTSPPSTSPRRASCAAPPAPPRCRPPSPIRPSCTACLHGAGGLAPIELLAGLAEGDAAPLLRTFADGGVEVAAELASPRRRLGLVLLSARASQLSWERAELELLRGLLAQAAIALETGLLLAERTRQAELEREMEIAAGIQASLLPASLRFAPAGRWRCAAARRATSAATSTASSPLPAVEGNGSAALVYGDVAGKSVPAALMMMAAHEVLHSLALTDRGPEELLALANRRSTSCGGAASSPSATSPRRDGDRAAALRARRPARAAAAARDGASRSCRSAATACRWARSPTATTCSTRWSVGARRARARLLRWRARRALAHRRLLRRRSARRRARRRSAGPDRGGRLHPLHLAAFTRGEDPYDDVTLVAVARHHEVPDA
jgi:hypothetical protein